MVAGFLEAKKLPETLKTFINTSLAETWEDKGEAVEGDSLLSHCEEYGPEELPDGIIVLTAGVDVQDDRLECEVVGWGKDGESWSVEYVVLDGDPSGLELWATLDDFLKSSYPLASGAVVKISAVAIDSGGHHTQTVYDFVRPVAKRRRRVWAIKGQSQSGKPIWPAKPSRNNSGRVPLYMIGTDSAKERIYSRLAIEEFGPGYCHFPDGEMYDEKYFAGLTAEKVITKYVKGFPARQWVPKSSSVRNEPLDCRVYALAAFTGLNANLKKIAARLALKATKPPEEKEEAEDATPDKEPESPVVPRPKKQTNRRRPRGGGFVKGWKK
jgi:phage terminase large subunit GpA-like protein